MRQRCAWCIPSRITTIDAEYLPIYAEEPGEQELVVLQCPAYMDSVQIPQPHFQRFPYSPMPNSSPGSSFLADGSHMPASGSSTNLPTTSERQPGRFGTGNESGTTSSNSSLTRANRGEAPPYFEVVLDTNHNDITSTESHSAESRSTESVAASHSPSSSSQKRIRLRSILNRISNSTASYASSAVSKFRPVPHHTRNGPRPKITTTSPSSRTMISSSSISAPLTYTTVRTVFIPRKGGGGLTADQVRRIYSRDSFGRFGVPYGPDAVAFASWLSRNDLVFGGRPPGFEEVVGCGSGGGGGGTTLRSDITDIIEGS